MKLYQVDCKLHIQQTPVIWLHLQSQWMVQWQFLDGYIDIIEMCFSVLTKVQVQEVFIKYKSLHETNDDDDFGIIEHDIDLHDELPQMVGFMYDWHVEVIEWNYM